MTLNDITRGLQLLYRDYILKEGAIDTGALYDSIEIVYKFEEEGPQVEVLAEPYLVYVDEGTRYIEPRNITDQWSNDPIFIDLMEELTVIWMEDYLERNLYGKRDKKGRFVSVK